MNLDWLIIGGGIHGVHIAARLLGEANVELEKVRVIDPGERLLERWRCCTETTGMLFLRSPSVHNLDPDPWSLNNLARKQQLSGMTVFAPPYNRPNLQLFNDHCDDVIDEYEIDGIHIRAKATDCSLDCNGATVSLSTGEEISSTNIVIAIGSGEQPEWPEWAPENSNRVHHVFEQDFDGWPSSKESVVVVGGGISAGQIALKLVDEGHEVNLVSRHEIRENQFDSDPGWLGPRNMNTFSKVKDLEKRRTMITEARHKGSMSPDVVAAIENQKSRGRLQHHIGEIGKVGLQNENLTISMKSGDEIKAQRVLLATGFSGYRPGGSFIDQLVESASLPCASCGYPIVNESLCWHNGVYVSGPLAELELGPASRNISGARKAAERIVAEAILKQKAN